MRPIASATAGATAGPVPVIERVTRFRWIDGGCLRRGVRHNVVAALEKAPDGSDTPVPQTKLEVGTQLAENYRAHGCIAGQYLFDSGQRARLFAVLWLEFIRALSADMLNHLPDIDARCAQDGMVIAL